MKEVDKPARPETREVFDLLAEVVDLTPEEREPIYAGHDSAVAAEVRAMIAADESKEGFLTPMTWSDEPVSTIDPQTGAGRRFGPYQLISILGEGGMGRVFLAEQSEPVQRRVALKILRFAIASEQWEARFEAERHAMGRLDHPNIGKLLEAGTTDEGVPFFAMELIEGEPITRYCDRRSLSIEDRLRIFVDVCRGTAHAHSRLVLHRDLKPNNILVPEVDGRAFPKIIDFGIAKGLGESLSSQAELTQHGFVGTPAYMSPEALGLGGEVDTRSDVFSLGILLYELLAGSLPWADAEAPPVAVLKERMQGDARRPSMRITESDAARRERTARQRGLEPAELPRRLRGDLDWIVMKAIAKEPDERYPSAAELADEAERFLRDEPVSARPPTAAYLVRKLVRRHRAAVLAAAVALLAVVLGIVGTTVGLLRAREAERRALGEAVTARQAQAEAKQVADFLVRLFEINDPGEMLGNTVTARELLDRGTEEIRERLADQPLIRARLMDTMGVVYRQLGLPKPAVPLVEEALEIRREQLGDEHPETVTSRVVLGQLYWLAGRYPEAQAVLEEALSQRERALGPEAPAVAEVLDHLGSAYAIQADWEPAEAAFARALAIREQVFGPESAETASSLDDLGVLFIDRGDPETAADYLRRTLAIRERSLGPEHPEVATACNGLAIAMLHLDEPEEARRLHQRALAIREKVLGADSPDVAQSLANLGQVFLDLDLVDQAESSLQQALDIWERQLGPEHRRTGIARFILADARRQRGALEAAEEDFRRALAIFEVSVGTEHPHYAVALQALAEVLRDRARYEEAEPLFRRALDLRGSIHGDDHPMVEGLREEFAELLRATGRDAEAQQLLEGTD